MSWKNQANNSDATVKVREGFNRDTAEPITEFIVADKAAREHHHIGINLEGTEVFNRTKQD